MTAFKAAAIALVTSVMMTALSAQLPHRTATRAWAQADSSATLSSDAAGDGVAPAWRTITMPVGTILTSKSNGEPQVELSPDQKLATAYALCVYSELNAVLQRTIRDELRNAPMPVETSQDCKAVEVAYERSHEHQRDADRAFIEEVARSLK
jgi:hypothetical protein